MDLLADRGLPVRPQPTSSPQGARQQANLTRLRAKPYSGKEPANKR